MPVRLKDIAERCNLAVSTVSNILNDHKDSYASERVKKLVKKTAEEMGYRKHYLSVSLRTRKTLSIGLCLDTIVHETRRVFVDSFVRGFNEKGYEVAITTHEMDPARTVESLRFFDERVKDGVVLFTDFLTDIGEQRQAIVDALARAQTKVLGIGSELKGTLPCLDIERTWAFRDCIRRFTRDKHQKIIVVYKVPGDFRSAFDALQDPRFVHLDNIYTAEDFQQRWPAAYEKHRDATAVFFRTDDIAIPALKYFADNGIRVPQDLCVSGFDHFRFSAYTTPSLTTYDINFAKLGSQAFFHLYRWIQGKKNLPADYYATTRPTFIERRSHRVTPKARGRS